MYEWLWCVDDSRAHITSLLLYSAIAILLLPLLCYNFLDVQRRIRTIVMLCDACMCDGSEEGRGGGLTRDDEAEEQMDTLSQSAI